MNITVVIRATEERTLEVCKALVEAQVGSENVIVIKVSPFHEAVKRTFEIGMERQTDWTVAIDADVLPFAGAFAKGLQRAGTLGDKLYSYHARVRDKVFEKYRVGGIHFFNTKLLPEALLALASFKDNVRPESRTYMKMAEWGYITCVDDYVIGLHDYEQSHRDYFRKGYFHSKKHGGSNDTIGLLNVWKAHIHDDDDFRALFSGWAYGFSSSEEVVNAAEFFDGIVAREFPKLGLTEKPPLTLDLDHWEQLLQKEQAATEHLKFRRSTSPKGRVRKAKDYAKSMIKNRLKKYVK